MINIKARRTYKQITKNLRQGSLLAKLSSHLPRSYRPAARGEERRALELLAESGQYSALENRLQTVAVSPELIKYRMPSRIKAAYKAKYNFDFQYYYAKNSKQRIVGMVLDGSWDIGDKGFEQIVAYSAFQDRFVGGKPWEETAYHKMYHTAYGQKNRRMRDTKTFLEFKTNYLQPWDNLYRAIKEKGYKSQAELSGRAEDEIEVSVSREGRLLFRDGKHRLLIAKILQIESVPVIVNVWHRQFIEHLKNKNQVSSITPALAMQTIIKESL